MLKDLCHKILHLHFFEVTPPKYKDTDDSYRRHHEVGDTNIISLPSNEMTPSAWAKRVPGDWDSAIDSRVA